MRLDDDDFTLFGLPARFDIDRQEVDTRWRALQAQVHPDRFASEGASAQRQAMQWAVRVNEAHRRLRDPLSRAAYLCELRGAPVQAERHTAMPQAFLMQQMHWREALEEATSAEQVSALDAEVAAQERTLFEVVALHLREPGDVPAAAETVRALMFLGRFRADIDKRLEALDHGSGH
jgi:molecular chaperone HscB